MMKNILNGSLFGLLILLSSQGQANGACPYITNATWSALDAALPCVNFPSLQNPNTQLQRELRPSLQQGVFTELVRRNKAEVICRENAYNQKLATAGEMDRISDAIMDRFIHYRQAFRSLRLASETDGRLTRMADGPRGEPGETAARGARNAQLAMRNAERNRQRDLLISRMPYGFEPHVAEAIRLLDEQLPDHFTREDAANSELFKSRIRNAFVSTSSAYNRSNAHFQSLWRATHCVIERPPQPAVTVYNDPEVAPRSCPAGQEERSGAFVQEEGTWRALSLSGSVVALAEDINHPVPNIQSVMRSTLTCNGDPYRAGRENLSSFGIIAGGLMLVPGLGPLVVGGIAMAVYGEQIVRSCYGQATGFRVTAQQSCSAGAGLDAAVHAADTTDCGADILEAAGVLAFSGITRSLSVTNRTLGLSGFADDGARALTSGADDAARAAGRTGDDFAEGGARVGDEAGEGQEIVVTGTRRRPRERDATAGGDARRGGTSGATSASDRAAGGAPSRGRESAPERVPDSSPSTRLVDRNIDNPDVRLSPAEERLLAQETHARKREIDELIGGRTGRDIHAEQAELNRYLERDDLEGYIRNRGFGRERAQRLRDSVRILQRERTVLTRARVNQDLDNLAALGATRRTVDCAPANALNALPAFHARARCSVVTFTRAVENYCACGAAGRLGAWAGPCAEHFLDYLTPGELADRDALPLGSARGLQECKRIRIPAGTTVIHGGLNPTMAGHGGAAQMFIPSRAMAPRVVDGVRDSSRLDGNAGTLRTLDIPQSAVTDAPRIDVIAVAPLHPDPNVTRIFSDARVCGGPGNCSQEDVNAFVLRFNVFARQNPEQVTDLQRTQFDEWTQWLRGCRDIDVSGASSYGPIVATRPGCGGL